MSDAVPADMVLAKTVEKFFTSIDWEFYWEWDDKPSDIIFKSGFQAAGHNFTLVVETSEGNETMKMFIYSPFEVPVHRIPDALKLINRLNVRMSMGRYAIIDDVPASIQWKSTIVVEDSQLAVRQVGHIQSYGASIFERDLEMFTRLVFTKMSAEEIWDDFRVVVSQPLSEAGNDRERIPEKL